ncbi:cysteine desulfurase family protein [Sporosarcina thermotolerans]|uniref:Cysteine desulfurase family protein n=1 Tax=Sporosarcina thermotolerans TaxID=633404 RepID=A0AAW9AFM0_9BACL|nr:cysteine desulfurase family protein [Sporosarcina thermotolerans]MDW0118491.1 cysteine desulfurase family protein [Sporosarcina thermotolerans]WHT47747.1 cysteine desulfurase family protein [Sporosarcina thermotolerans]
MIYFDNSATTQPNESVLESFIAANMRFYANPASLHRMGREAEVLLKRSKEQMLTLIDNEDGEVVITSGGTEANNLAIIGFAQAYKTRGNHIITTEIEHPSILNACRQLEGEGFEIDYLPVDDSGMISLKELESKLKKETILVSIMHVNNEIGTIQPISQCAELIKRNGRAIFHSDCVQSFGKLPVSMESLGVDAITISAHKINGLKGSGALFLKKPIKPNAINFGGGQENGLRSGTVSVPNAVSMAKAMRISAVNNESKHFREWRNKIINVCDEIELVEVLSPQNAAPHIISLAFKSIKGEVAINYFQEQGIIISTSSACFSKNKSASHVIEAIGLDKNFKNGVIRVSFGNTNTEAEIETFIKVLRQFVELIERGI